MKLLRLHALPAQPDLPPLAVSIGNFDGVHLGHQAMIARLQTLARAQGLQTLVMVFEPQPQEFFRPESAPPRLTSFREKIELLRALGVDHVLVARFDQQFRSLSAEAFADLLRDRLNVRQLVLGDDFRFGQDRRGDAQFLQSHGFEVETLHTILVAGERVSSTRIRQCLQAGEFAHAAELLGRRYSISGRVVYGDQIGRTLDFPTANIALRRIQPPLRGIYAVEVQPEGARGWPGAVAGQGTAGLLPGGLFGAGHVGTRPAIAGAHEWRLEVHLPRLSANLYGLRLRVTFWSLLHGERHYPSLEALRAGIQQDVEALGAWRAAQDQAVF